jgi:regulator of protease activity HflC (stomatin/prohibitin superfamily)
MMIVLGVEIVLNFVLTMYRPRRPGEMPKPAFESQVLGFVAAPDRIAQSIGGAINYQFGFDVTSSWFYQLLSRSLTALLVVGALVIWAMTWVAVVKPNEQGLLLRGGRLVGKPLSPGIYLKWPWPIEHVEREETTTPRRLDLAGLQPGDVKSLLWTNEHKVKGGEKYLIVQPSAADKAATARSEEAPGGAESGWAQPGTKGAGEPATAGAAPGGAMGNIALVSIEIPVIYEIVDLEKYQALAQNDQMRDSLLQGIGRREIMKYLATRSVDDVLGNGRGETSRDLINRVEDRFKNLDAGVKVLFVGIVGVHPPIDTAADFEKVVSSEQQRKGAIEAALTEQTRTLTKAVGSVELAREIVVALDALEAARARGDTEEDYIKQQQKIEDLLTRAGGEAAVKIQQAKADRWVRHMGARGRAERYMGQLLAYRAGGAVYTAQLYFDMVSELMKSARVYIVPDGTKVPIEMRADMQETDTGSNVFQKIRKDEDMGK